MYEGLFLAHDYEFAPCPLYRFRLPVFSSCAAFHQRTLSPAGREEVLDSWMRETIKLRNSVGKRGTKGVPIVSKVS